VPQSKPNCTVCGTQPSSVFCSVLGMHLETLDSEKSVHNYSRGQVIFHEGFPASGIHCIYSGRTKLYKTGQSGHSLVVRLLGPTDVMGLCAVFSDAPYSVTAEALDSATVCYLPKEAIFEVIQNSPQLSLALMSKLANELRTSENRLVEIAQDSALQRTARLLQWFHRTLPGAANHAQPMTVPLKRGEMAQMIGTKPETFSRMLRELSDKSIIQHSRSTITILDPEALDRLTAA
jgi:CRP-like cAMP-binding protein